MVDFIQQIPIWQLWLVAAFILFALEVLTPGFILACFGVGALVAIPVAALGLSWLVQIIAFCIGSLLALWLLQPLMCRWFQSHDTKTGMDALIGRRVFVSEEILPGDAGGRVAVTAIAGEPSHMGRQSPSPLAPRYVSEATRASYSR